MIFPPSLRPGDTVAIIAPASPFAYADLRPALDIMRNQWQLNIWEGKTLQLSTGAFAGSDAERADDLQEAINNPAIKAIFAARGGYGAYRLVEQVNFKPLLKQPKWLVGFSDITVLLSHCQRMGLGTLHAIMPRGFRLPHTEQDIETLRQWLFGEKVAPYTAPVHELNRTGRASGQLAGGNLSLLMHILDTPSEVDWAGKLVFIEDIDETLFSLDRMLIQLRRSGKLANLAGLLVGHFSDMRDNTTTPLGKTPEQLVADAVADYTYPVAFNVPIGHVSPNLAMPVGMVASLSATKNGMMLSF
ncbi:S66 peptidase family protein [Fibrella aquatilis]|uniref:LD-carboxypeptidase n=1 Tax=Fibrella aquatilis TaxID=2817059 RepID=A0A939JVZ8_9BACT|nr:LD-carboxypeptidase [Fibrella aquatilis]MBO0929484.1 LD-carboxypeptidase [Fibrella aquatilis]